MKRISGKRSPFSSDVILEQEFFEPYGWAHPIEEQIKLLQEVYLIGSSADKGYVSERLRSRTPEGFVKVAVPKLEFLGRCADLNINPYNSIGVLIEQVCALLSSSRKGKFTHYRKGQLEPTHVRCIQGLISRRIELELSIPGDILVLDVSLGSQYVGWTPRRARENIILQNKQLALSSVDIAWILLVNPDRFQHCDHLSVDSVMEEYFSDDRLWECVLFFYFRGNKLEFGYRWGRRAYIDSGAAIALL